MQTSDLPTEFMVVVSAHETDFNRFKRAKMSGILRTIKQCHYFVKGDEVTQAVYISTLVQRALIDGDFTDSEIPPAKMERDKLSGMVVVMGMQVYFLGGRIVTQDDYETAIYGEVLQLTRYFEANFN